MCVTPYWLTTLQLHYQVISLNKETMTNLPYISPPCNLDAMGSLGLAKWGGQMLLRVRGGTSATSGSLLGSMSIAKLTSIRTVIRITCETNGKLTALTTVQWLQHGRNVREFTLLVPVVPVGVNSPGSMQTKPNPPKKKHM